MCSISYLSLDPWTSLILSLPTLKVLNLLKGVVKFASEHGVLLGDIFEHLDVVVARPSVLLREGCASGLSLLRLQPEVLFL